MNKKKPFSLRARARSFVYAFKGLLHFFSAEHNALVHLFAAVIVLVMAIILHVSRGEAIALVIVVGFVWVAELFNTAIERMMDFISPEQDPRTKIIKDLAAAAVLIAAIVALITGCIIFIPKF